MTYIVGKEIHPPMFQIIGNNLDVLVMIVIGVFAIFNPHSLVKKKGAPEEITKRVRILKLAGAILIVSGLAQALFKYFT